MRMLNAVLNVRIQFEIIIAQRIQKNVKTVISQKQKIFTKNERRAHPNLEYYIIIWYSTIDTLHCQPVSKTNCSRHLSTTCTPASYWWWVLTFVFDAGFSGYTSWKSAHGAASLIYTSCYDHEFLSFNIRERNDQIKQGPKQELFGIEHKRKLQSKILDKMRVIISHSNKLLVFLQHHRQE